MYKEGCGCPHKWAKMKDQLADIKGKNGIMDGEDSNGKMVKIVVIKGPKMLKAQADNTAIWKRLRKLKEGLVNEFVPKPGTHGRPPLVPQVPGGPGKFQDPLEWEQEQRLRELDRKMKEFEKRMLQMRLDMEKSMKDIEAREKYLLQQIEELDLRDAGEEPPPGNYWDGK